MSPQELKNIEDKFVKFKKEIEAKLYQIGRDNFDEELKHYLFEELEDRITTIEEKTGITKEDEK